MTWEQFQDKASEEGLKPEDKIDAIEMVGNRYDICYTTSEGYQGVLEIRGD